MHETWFKLRSLTDFESRVGMDSFNWDAVTALATVALAAVTLIGVGAAIYAGLYAKKAHEVVQSQRQIENIFRYIESLEALLNRIISIPTLGDISYREALIYQVNHPSEFEINQSGWPVKAGASLTENTVLKHLLELLNIFSLSILESSADFRILYFRYGQYMQFIFQEMNRTEATRTNLAKYQHFVKVMTGCTEQWENLPLKSQFT
jgi:hypothetical protein